MRYSYVSAVLALASSTVAQTFFDAIQTPAENQILVAGTPFDLVWNPAGVTGKATIQLNEGLTNTTLQLGPIIAQSIDNTLGKFTWTPEDRGHPTYGWQITLDNDSTKQELSHFFHIASNGSSSTISATSTSTVKLATGPSYTSTTSSTSTTVIPSSTMTVVTTQTSAFPTITPSGNRTTTSYVLTTNAPSSTASKSSSTGSSTSSAAATTSSSAAIANAARGGLVVVGGFVLALAL